MPIPLLGTPEEARVLIAAAHERVLLRDFHGAIDLLNLAVSRGAPPVESQTVEALVAAAQRRDTLRRQLAEGLDIADPEDRSAQERSLRIFLRDPDLSADAALQLTALLADEGRVDEAVRVLESVAVAGEARARLQMALATLRLERDEVLEALACVDRALEADPGHAEALLLRMRLLVDDDPAAAAAAGRRFLATARRDHPLWSLAEEWVDGWFSQHPDERAAQFRPHVLDLQLLLFALLDLVAYDSEWTTVSSIQRILAGDHRVDPLLRRALHAKMRPHGTPDPDAPVPPSMVEHGPRTRSPFVSCLCRQEHFHEEWYDRLRRELLQPDSWHRKSWEFVVIADTLEQSGLLVPGARAVGFGVGTEPLPAWLAARGCEVVATDLEAEAAAAQGWTATKQHSAAVEQLFVRGICPWDDFARRVTFQPADMNAIDPSLQRGEFDISWSACAFEHLGSIAAGLRFVREQMACLRPGGMAIHTTEFNIGSDDDTIDNEGTVIFRRRDLEALAHDLRADGHAVELDLIPGTGEIDRYIDVPPYRITGSRHLRLLLQRHVTTSVAIIVRKAR